ncbi:SPOR domain-containing protein [Craterilacuibacter sp. RT1T]|uniref:SPOR domain-containing protein n=1 Tax=Craterilacuibacter sp. RT1T TaxID=2942211 RepID=UPI0020BDB66D|nr:SPOR domain-containing protein [Craterilacuibacter sp. RT1T]MCL6263114.1 SPOR domain-containing protein [Craterilacuibacter sp. RT1T]
MRKRARRRLVGAVALVLIATVVLWNVLGAIPDQKMKPEAIEVIGHAASEAAAAVAVPDASAPVLDAVPEASGPTEIVASLPTEPEPVPLPAVAVASPPASLPVVKPVPEPVKVAPKPEPVKPQPKLETVKAPAAVERDPLAILEGRESHAPAKTEAAPSGRFMVQLAALSDPAKVDALRARLAANGMSAQFSKVQTSKGEVVRVRMGPYGSQAEAQAALARLSKAGVSGMVVSAK